jgi:hypothetical protein
MTSGPIWKTCKRLRVFISCQCLSLDFLSHHHQPYPPSVPLSFYITLEKEISFLRYMWHPETAISFSFSRTPTHRRHAPPGRLSETRHNYLRPQSRPRPLACPHRQSRRPASLSHQRRPSTRRGHRPSRRLEYVLQPFGVDGKRRPRRRSIPTCR